MNNNKSGSIIAGVLIVALVGGGVVWLSNRDSTKTADTNQSQTAIPVAKESSMDKQDIVATASGTESLSTLVTAVKAASLVETLQGPGPFTVFAPTNAAFSNLPAGTLDSLLKPENVQQLKSILTYHVVPGSVMSKDLQNGQVIKTVQGSNLTVEIMDGKVYLVDSKGAKAMVTTADVSTSNGVVHIIDTVVQP